MARIELASQSGLNQRTLPQSTNTSTDLDALEPGREYVVFYNHPQNPAARSGFLRAVALRGYEQQMFWAAGATSATLLIRAKVSAAADWGPWHTPN